MLCSELEEDMNYSRKRMINIRNQGSTLGAAVKQRLFNF